MSIIQSTTEYDWLPSIISIDEDELEITRNEIVFPEPLFPAGLTYTRNTSRSNGMLLKS